MPRVDASHRGGVGMRHGRGGVAKASTYVRCNAWHANGLCVTCARHMHMHMHTCNMHTCTCIHAHAHAYMHMHMHMQHATCNMHMHMPCMACACACACACAWRVHGMCMPCTCTCTCICICLREVEDGGVDEHLVGVGVAVQRGRDPRRRPDRRPLRRRDGGGGGGGGAVAWLPSPPHDHVGAWQSTGRARGEHGVSRATEYNRWGASQVRMAATHGRSGGVPRRSVPRARAYVENTRAQLLPP
jgi:hypothetical protein